MASAKISYRKQSIDNVMFYHQGDEDRLGNPEDRSPPPEYSGGDSGRSSPIAEIPLSALQVKSRFSQISQEDIPLQDSCMSFMSSQKGHELSKGTSLMMAVTLLVIGLTLLLSHHLSDILIGTSDISVFMLVMCTVSAVTFFIIVFLGCMNKLTTDDHYKNQKGTVFLRGGVTALATGGIIYYVVELVFLTSGTKSCTTPLLAGKNFMAIAFTILQVGFLMRFSKIRINHSLSVVILSRFMLMFVIATNGVVWLKTVLDETVEEIYYKLEDILEHSKNNSLTMETNATDLHEKLAALHTNYDNQCSSKLGHLIEPFVFPLLIEFCVVAGTMVLAIWEKCGIGLETSTNSDLESLAAPENPRRVSQAFSLNSLVSHNDSSDGIQKSGFYNSNIGLVFGWVTIVTALVAVILVLYAINVGYENKGLLDDVVYGTNLSLTTCVLLTIPLTIHRMSSMCFKDEEIRYMRKGARSIKKKPRLHRKLDQNLLTITFLALLTYKLMSILAAVESRESVIVVDGIVSILMGFLQTGFINWYACHKRVKTQKERAEKPGRQCLEFLRFANLSLWLINTFLLKQTEAKGVQGLAFGDITWIVVSNILQPLTILYHFHSMICLAEIITHSYTDKYVGIQRPSKLRARQSVVTLSFPDPTEDRSVRTSTANLMQNMTLASHSQL